jgi:hypothetical protein
MHINYRILKIAPVVVWSLACSAFAMFVFIVWLLSFVQTDYLTAKLPGNWDCIVCSAHNRLIVVLMPHHDSITYYGYVRTGPMSQAGIDNDRLDSPFGLGSRSMPAGYQVLFCHWYLICTLAVLAAFPWLLYVFRLRTLLIAIAMVVAMLVMIVWSTR